MKKETKEEVNKHLEGFVKYYLNSETIKTVKQGLAVYQKKHNLIPSIEVGKIYRYDNDVFKCIEIKDNGLYGYGFNCHMNFLNRNTIWAEIDDELTEATQEEWESMLLEKAKKDYPKGTKYNDVGCDGKPICTIGGEFNYLNMGTIGYITDGYGGSVYYNGVWASILEEVKTEETEKETIIRIPKGVEFEFKVK